MRTNIKPLVLALGFGLLLLAPRRACAYYNPSTGKWINRDPIEEEGGRNLYALLSGDALNNCDNLGQKAIHLGFGFDSSANLTDPDEIRRSRITKVINQNLMFLFRMVRECIALKLRCACNPDPGDPPGFSMTYDRSTDKPAPLTRSYDLDTVEGTRLAMENLEKIKGNPVHILVSRKHIWSGGGWRVAATEPSGTFPPSPTEYGGGILWDVNSSEDRIIAHELGHVANYIGDDPTSPRHSKDPGNLMFKYGGSKPDCQWCQKVFGLAK